MLFFSNSSHFSATKFLWITLAPFPAVEWHLILSVFPLCETLFCLFKSKFLTFIWSWVIGKDDLPWSSSVDGEIMTLLWNYNQWELWLHNWENSVCDLVRTLTQMCALSPFFLQTFLCHVCRFWGFCLRALIIQTITFFSCRNFKT